MILVTQKQVLQLYITVIECKTLYGLCVPHTVFPNATKATTKETTNAITNEVHVTKDRGIRTSHIIWWRSARQQVSIQPQRKTMTRRKEDLTTFNSSENGKKLKFGFVYFSLILYLKRQPAS